MKYVYISYIFFFLSQVENEWDSICSTKNLPLTGRMLVLFHDYTGFKIIKAFVSLYFYFLDFFPVSMVYCMYKKAVFFYERHAEC